MKIMIFALGFRVELGALHFHVLQEIVQLPDVVDGLHHVREIGQGHLAGLPQLAREVDQHHHHFFRRISGGYGEHHGAQVRGLAGERLPDDHHVRSLTFDVNDRRFSVRSSMPITA